MAAFNNNGTITLSFEYKSKRFVLSGLGSYSDTKQLKAAKAGQTNRATHQGRPQS